MEDILSVRKSFPAFLMLLALFVLMYSGWILSQIAVKMTLPIFFDISNPDLFMNSLSEQIKNPPAAIYLQAVCSSIGFFLLPVIVYHAIFSYDMVGSMGMKRIPAARYWLLGLAVMFLAGIFIQWLVQINSAIPLSGEWKSLRTMQEDLQKLTDAFFAGAGGMRFLELTFVMALLPAIAEEFCFRGTIQQTLYRTNLGPMGAVVVTGLTFSLVHFEFDNFLAIWCMGIVLGLLCYYSGSVWVNVAAHFFNNFIAVACKYAYMKGLIHTDVAGNDTLPLYITLPAGALMVAGLILMKRWQGPKPVPGSDGQINTGITG